MSQPAYPNITNPKEGGMHVVAGHPASPQALAVRDPQQLVSPTSPNVRHSQTLQVPSSSSDVRTVVMPPVAAGYQNMSYPTMGFAGNLLPAQVLGVLNLLQIDATNDMVFWCRSSMETLKKAESDRRWVVMAFYFVVCAFIPPLWSFFPIWMFFLFAFYCCSCGDSLTPFYKNGEGTLTIATRSRGVIQYNVHTHSSVEIPWAQAEGFEHYEPGVKEACGIRPQHCCVHEPVKCMVTVLLPGQHQVLDGFWQGAKGLKDQRVIFCEPQEFDFVLGNLTYLKSQHSHLTGGNNGSNVLQNATVPQNPLPTQNVVLGTVSSEENSNEIARRLSVRGGNPSAGSVVVCGSPVNGTVVQNAQTQISPVNGNVIVPGPMPVTVEYVTKEYVTEETTNNTYIGQQNGCVGQQNNQQNNVGEVTQNNVGQQNNVGEMQYNQQNNVAWKVVN